MKDEKIRFATPVIVGFAIWLLAFFIVGFTQMPGGPKELYLPMVALSTLVWLIIAFFAFWYYSKKWEVKTEWLREAVIFGAIMMILQFVFDILSFMGFLGYNLGTFINDYLLKSTVLIMYPLIIVEMVLIGYILVKLGKIVN